MAVRSQTTLGDLRSCQLFRKVGNCQLLHLLVCPPDHARGHRVVAVGVDQDEVARGAVDLVGVEEERLGRDQPHAADLVQLKRLGRLAVQRVHVDAVGQLVDVAAHLARGVLHDVGRAPVERLLAHPAQRAFQGRAGLGQVAGAHDHVPAADVDLVLQRQQSPSRPRPPPPARRRR